MRRIWKIGLVVVFGLGLAGCAWLFAPPQAVLTASVTSGTAPLPVQFDLSGSTGDIVSYTLTFGDDSDPATGSDITVAVVHTYEDPGDYIATLTVQDARGRTSSASVGITVSAAPTTTVSLGAVPASGPAPLDVEFWATISAAPGRRIKHVALDYETDGTPDFESDVDFATYDWWIGLYEYTTPGTYTATLTVTDDASPAQAFTATATITVTSPPPEITAFTATPQTPSVGADVTFAFEAEAGDAARKLVKWELRSGDGYVVTVVLTTPASTLNVTHDYAGGYAQTGSYTATVKVWDDLTPTANTDEATLDVDVVAP
ncbi:MAG: PKD domain-containing protein [Candidatus Bipolaricaulis anaerobius]|nr:PKD domain-containing protein [Candidatus Bipolaricaulis anaerobius]